MEKRYWLYLLVVIILLVIILYIHTAMNRRKHAQIETFRIAELPLALNRENLFIEDPNIWCNKLATYWLFMNQPNVEARGQNKLVELQEKYRSSGIQPISNVEKRDITAALELNIKSLATSNPNIYHYLKYWSQRFKLAKGANWLEGGMPHTHEDVIILPASYFTPTGFQFPTFFHEITHIHQRKYPEDWDDLIWRWGFQHYNFLDSPASGLENIMARNRTNPDGLDVNYVWKCPTSSKYYWIGAIYSTITPTSLTDGIQYIACELNLDNSNNYRFTGTTINLAQFGGFIDYFGVRNNNYHPNEIIAEYMAKYLVGEELSNAGYQIFKRHVETLIWPKYQNDEN